MRTSSNSVVCPQCGNQATITISERADPTQDAKRHEVTFACAGACGSPTGAESLILWGAGPLDAPVPPSTDCRPAG